MDGWENGARATAAEAAEAAARDGAEPDGWDLLPRSYHDPSVRWREIDAPAFEALEAAYEN